MTSNARNDQGIDIILVINCNYWYYRLSIASQLRQSQMNGDSHRPRLVLVGDRGPLRAVEAGQPFRLLHRAGMATAEMNEILRQREPKLRGAVNAVLDGEPGEAVDLLGSSVHEVA